MKDEGEESNDSFKSCKSQFNLSIYKDYVAEFIEKIYRENFRGNFIQYFSWEDITITGYKLLLNTEANGENIKAELKFKKYIEASIFKGKYLGELKFNDQIQINYFIYEGKYYDIYSKIEFENSKNNIIDKKNKWKNKILSEIELIIFNSSLPEIDLIFSIDDIFFHINSGYPILLVNQKLFNLNNGEFKRRLGVSTNQNLIETWIMVFSLLIGGKNFLNEIFRLLNLNQELTIDSLNLILNDFNSLLNKTENEQLKEKIPFAKYLLNILFEKKSQNFNIHQVIQHIIELKNNKINNLPNQLNFETFQSNNLNINNSEIKINDISNQLNEYFENKNESKNKIILIGNDTSPYLSFEDKSKNQSLYFKKRILKSDSSLNISKTSIFQGEVCIENSLEYFIKCDISKLNIDKSLSNINEDSIIILIKRVLRNLDIYEKPNKLLSKSSSCDLFNHNFNKILKCKKLPIRDPKHNKFLNNLTLKNVKNTTIHNITNLSIFHNQINNQNKLKEIKEIKEIEFEKDQNFLNVTDLPEETKQIKDHDSKRIESNKRYQDLTNSENTKNNELIVNNKVLIEKMRLEEENKQIKIKHKETIEEMNKEKITLLKDIKELKNELETKSETENLNEKQIKKCKDKLQILKSFIKENKLEELFLNQLKKNDKKRSFK